MKNTLANCNEDAYLPSLHLSTVELYTLQVARKIASCDIVVLRHNNPSEKLSTSSEVPQNHNDLPSIPAISLAVISSNLTLIIEDPNITHTNINRAECH